MTRVYTIDPAHPQGVALQVAANTLRRGGLVAFPTETVYGLGANALDVDAVTRIFQAKGRPANDPVIVHIRDLAQLDLVAERPDNPAFHAALSLWPGALTLILRRRPIVPAVVSAGLDTVAVRMPSGAVIRALLEAAQIPIAAPSANTFSRPSATTAAHVLEDLDGRIDIVLDGGATALGLESTILDLTGDTPLILRPGGISHERLRALIPTVMQRERLLDMNETATAPGMLIRHYSPRARLLLFDGEPDDARHAMLAELRALVAQGKCAGVLAVEEDCASFAEADAALEILGSEADMEAVGRRLFAAMRALDALGADVILARTLSRAGVGAAIYDRLLRAAEGRVIHVRH
jgi:L-threonylcarbamoyladenylate synthase